MEKAVEFCEQKSSSRLLFEIIFQGKELAEQLRNHNLDPSSSPPETTQLLLEKILYTQEKALSMLNWGAFVGESPRVLADVSPRSNVSDPSPKGQFSRDVNKRRKTQPRWTEQVKVCSGTGLEGPPDDGYSWRKYGQKDILGSNFPRGYYRCTHRHSQGCLAIKQVQRSDQDHTIYEVTYRGRHTCSSSSQSKSPLFPNNEIDQPIKKNPTPKPFDAIRTPLTIRSDSYNHLVDGLNEVIKTEGSDSREDVFQPFSFPKPAPMVEDNLFLSPATSESNFLAMSPYQTDSFGIAVNAYTSESDLTDIVSTHSSVANSPIGAGFEIAFDDTLDFEELFQLGNDPGSWLS